MNRLSGVLIGACWIGCLSACASWGDRPRLASSPALPNAKGTVRFYRTYDQGTLIDLRVKNLAEPEELIPPGYAYVAWVQGGHEAEPQNVGALEVGQDFQGELRTTTELADFALFVTAEASSDVMLPSGPALLWTRQDD